MKQLTRTVIYWPGIDSDIVDLCRSCVTCAEHQNTPPKSQVHSWILPKKTLEQTAYRSCCEIFGDKIGW